MSRTGVAIAALAVVVGACSSGQSAKPAATDASMDATNEDAPVVACTSVNDCRLAPYPMVCCLDKVCAFSDGETSLVDCTDANAQLIEASSYDQSCTADTDCVAVSEGNACHPGFLNCPNAAISVSAHARYNADVAMTNAAICIWEGDCALSGGPCCRGSRCQMGASCLSGSQADAAAEASTDGGADANQTAPCSAAADCTSGGVCCVSSAINETPTCHAAPCPDLPGFGVFQLCSTAAECITAGDICAPQGGGRLPVPICQAPPGDGATGSSHDAGSASDAPAGG
jgi:hypothetical protein